MQVFLASDVVYTLARAAADRGGAARRRHRRPAARSGSQFLPGIEWLDPSVVADALGQQLSARRRRQRPRARARPARHRHRLGAGRRPDADAGRGRTGSPTAPDTEFTVNFTNQGENDEVDVQVVLKIEGGPKPIRVTKTVASVAAGAAADGDARRSARRRRWARRSRSPSRSSRSPARRRRTTTRRVRRRFFARVGVAALVS